MRIFHYEFVGTYLRIPTDRMLSKKDREQVSEAVDELILQIGIQDRKEESKWHIAGKMLVHPQYNGDATLSWIGTKAIAGIEKFVHGHHVSRFNARTLDLIAGICGYYGGFYGYLQGRKLPIELLLTIDHTWRAMIIGDLTLR